MDAVDFNEGRADFTVAARPSLSRYCSFAGGAVVQPGRREGILVTHGVEFFGGPLSALQLVEAARVCVAS